MVVGKSSASDPMKVEIFDIQQATRLARNPEE